MTWKEMISRSITTSDDLEQYMQLTAEQKAHYDAILERFPMLVTPYYLSLIDWDHYHDDPVFRLCIPSLEETDLGGSFDTSGEAGNTRLRGVQHKYRETALILTTQSCAVYCRHCFRKRLVGLEAQKETARNPQEVYAYVAAHPEISNVLLSGGDAFMLDNAQIRRYLELLSEIPHLDLIRIGTRTPVTLPMKIYEDTDLLEILTEFNRKKQIVVVTHFNHPNEITPESTRAVRCLLQAGIPVRNQTVLLHGVNNDSLVLGTLLKKLTSIGVIPYYIFQCRPVTGVQKQFQVPILEGYRIVQEALQMQNGQGKCVRYVMSHPTGKIEFLGPLPESTAVTTVQDPAGKKEQKASETSFSDRTARDRMLMKYQQAKDETDAGRLFTISLEPGQCWIDEIP